MRLINVETEKFEEFVVSSSDTLKYAILSHAWDSDGEITFQDFKDHGLHLLNKKGHKKGHKGLTKIAMTCSLARKDDIPYVWVDTCCIDKTSSAELTEAINSMFNWYQDAQVCYVWLADLPAATEESIDSSLKRCRWFTRGWTLQEVTHP
ncbi:putative HET domain protein [Rosellinia necatrix]|uniref:Putative HET domain protein n=1 Tax=Rosellinia necatrix TaxID=77044 RepID=A0A1S8A9F8_ROSNE|nr:putative HET domain protein [Rosellinia necatrix]